MSSPVPHKTPRHFAAFALLYALATPAAAARQRRVTEEFRHFVNFNSTHVKWKRDILVWLPPGYETETTRRYPVLYMHDGMTVFITWRLDETAKALIASKEIEPLIIVMVPNGGPPEARFEQYTPTRPVAAPAGGKADDSGRMLAEELKPFIDSEFRTLTDAANTGLGGASLGGLVSLYLGLKRPEVFGRLAVMSPSVWWDGRVILRNVNKLDARTPARIWLDVGTGEGRGMVDNAKELRDALVKKGWALDTDLKYHEERDAPHDDKAFAARAGEMLKFLFPPKAAP